MLKLKNRLKDIKQRGVVLRTGENLKSMYEIRRQLYEGYADITISEDDGSIEDTVQAVLEAIE